MENKPHKIHVTENKSRGTLSQHGVARVFVDGDYNYGYWVPETVIIRVLGDQALPAYLAGVEFRCETTKEQAQALIDAGSSPYTKQKL